MSAPSILLCPVSDRIAEAMVANDAPALALTTRGDGRLHVFGVAERPRFHLERPYSPDDAWSFAVDATGGLSRDLPPVPWQASAEVEAFLERPLDDASRRLVGALPTGRYLLVRSPRTLTREPRVLLGNELVPSPPNALVLGLTEDAYAVAFGARPSQAPDAAGLLVGVAVLAYSGQDTMDGMWLFDLSGAPSPEAAPVETTMVLPLEGPLVIDAVAAFREKGNRETQERWASERGVAFARWCAGD